MRRLNCKAPNPLSFLHLVFHPLNHFSCPFVLFLSAQIQLYHESDTQLLNIHHEGWSLWAVSLAHLYVFCTIEQECHDPTYTICSFLGPDLSWPWIANVNCLHNVHFGASFWSLADKIYIVLNWMGTRGEQRCCMPVSSLNSPASFFLQSTAVLSLRSMTSENKWWTAAWVQDLALFGQAKSGLSMSGK